MPNFEENERILERIRKLKGWRRVGAGRKLADLLDVSETVISNWKTRSPIDLNLLREKLSPEEFIIATTGDENGIKEVEESEFVSRVEFLSEVTALSRRVDELKAALDVALKSSSQKRKR